MQLCFFRAVQHNIFEATASACRFLQICIGFYLRFIHNGISLQLNGFDGSAGIRHNQACNGAVLEKDAAFACLAFSRSVDNHISQNVNVFKNRTAKANPPCNIEIPLNHCILQGNTGGGNRNIPLLCSQRDCAGLFHQFAHGIRKHLGHLRPGNIILRLEGIILIAGNKAFIGRGIYIAPAPVGNACTIQKGRGNPRRFLKGQISAQQRNGLLSRQAALGISRSPSVAGKIALIIGNGNIIGIPFRTVNILKRCSSGFGIPKGTIDNGYKFRPCNGLIGVHVSVFIPAYNASVV